MARKKDVSPAGSYADSQTTYRITVDYDRTLAEMVEAGHYDAAKGYATQNFRVTGRGSVELDCVLVHLDRGSSTLQEVKSEIKERGLRPARLEELLAFGEAYPDIQRDFPVVELGSVAADSGGNCHVVRLWSRASRRYLSLRSCGDGWTSDGPDWHSTDRFLAINDGEEPLSTLRVTVDYDRPLAEIAAAGCYDHYINDSLVSDEYADQCIIADNFPITRSGMVELDCLLVHLERSANTEEVESEFDRCGLRPARLEELLAFGEAYPDIQRDFPVVELGSVWVDSNGDRRVACLWNGASHRRLRTGLNWCEGGWGSDYRFLAVRT